MKINTVYKYKSIVLFVILSITIGACQSFEGRTKTIVGGLGGAAAGGLLAGAAGGGTEWIAAGSLLGALVGGAIGDRLDAADRRQEPLRHGEIRIPVMPALSHQSVLTRP